MSFPDCPEYVAILNPVYKIPYFPKLLNDKRFVNSLPKSDLNCKVFKVSNHLRKSIKYILLNFKIFLLIYKLTTLLELEFFFNAFVLMICEKDTSIVKS